MGNDSPVGFNGLVLFNQVIKNIVIIGMEDMSSDLWKTREQITRTSSSFTTLFNVGMNTSIIICFPYSNKISHLMSSTKLTSRYKQVDIVTANEILGHTNDCSCNTSFTVMVFGDTSDVVGQLSNLQWTIEGSAPIHAKYVFLFLPWLLYSWIVSWCRIKPCVDQASSHQPPKEWIECYLPYWIA